MNPQPINPCDPYTLHVHEDGAGCTPTPPSTWEQRFDEQFPGDFIRYPSAGKQIEDQQYIEVSTYAHTRSSLKAFIAQEIARAREEECRIFYGRLG